MDVKGPEDDYGYKRLKDFIAFHGVQFLVCKTEQEKSVIAALKSVAGKLWKDGMQIAFEQTPIGESQSNGKPERLVQAAEEPLEETQIGIDGSPEDQAA